MENKSTERFDLTRLLRQSDLNIRGVAAAAPEKTAGEYFEKLSELTNLSPMYSEDLRKLINRDGERNTYKNVAGLFSLLKDLGYEKHASNFDGILDAYDRGHTRLISTYAKNIIDDFYDLCKHIIAARIIQSAETSDADPYEITLGEWIERKSVEAQTVRDANDKPVILAVDDSPVILKAVSAVLGGDYKVFTLLKPMELEKILHKLKPDLFLLDYKMPEISGFDLVPIIRGIEGHEDTPIIFLTSEGTIDNVTAASLLGASDFMVKPFKPDMLRNKVAKHIV